MIFLIMGSIRNSNSFLTHIIFRPDHNICILVFLFRCLAVKEKLEQNNHRRMSLYSRILTDKEIDRPLFQPFQIFFQEIIGDHMHGFILSKLLQGLADTLYAMTRNIDPGQLRI